MGGEEGSSGEGSEVLTARERRGGKGGGVRLDTNGEVGVYIAAIYTPSLSGEGKSTPGSGIRDRDQAFGLFVGLFDNTNGGRGPGIGIGIRYSGWGSGFTLISKKLHAYNLN